MRLVLDRNVRVRMRDGVELGTDVLRPDVSERIPVILSRTPYDRALVRVGDITEHTELAERGYAVITQDVRGRYGSGGVFNPYEQELNDGYDVVEWASHQPWSTGRVAMHGASYLGATQWLAAMAARRACEPSCPTSPQRITTRAGRIRAEPSSWDSCSGGATRTGWPASRAPRTPPATTGAWPLSTRSIA